MPKDVLTIMAVLPIVSFVSLVILLCVKFFLHLHRKKKRSGDIVPVYPRTYQNGNMSGDNVPVGSNEKKGFNFSTFLAVCSIILGAIPIGLGMIQPNIVFSNEDGNLMVEIRPYSPIYRTYYSFDNLTFQEYSEKFSVNEGTTVWAYSKFWFIDSARSKETAEWQWEPAVTLDAELRGSEARLRLVLNDRRSEDGEPLFGDGDARVTLDWENEGVSSEGLLSTKLTIWGENKEWYHDFPDMQRSTKYPTEISDTAAAFFMTGNVQDCVSFEIKDLGVTAILSKAGLRECLEDNNKVTLEISRTEELSGVVGVDLLLNGEVKADIPGGVALRIDDCDDHIVPAIMSGGYVSTPKYCQRGNVVVVGANSGFQMVFFKDGEVSRGDRRTEEEAMRFVKTRYIYTGYGLDEFKPESMITYGELAQAIANMSGGPELDLTMPHWYDRAISWAHEKGLICEENLDGDAPVTREQCLTILWRFAGSPGSDRKELLFEDLDKISEQAADAVKWALDWDIIEGSEGKLSPTSPITRAEAALYIMNMYLKIADMMVAAW